MVTRLAIGRLTGPKDSLMVNSLSLSLCARSLLQAFSRLLGRNSNKTTAYLYSFNDVTMSKMVHILTYVQGMNVLCSLVRHQVLQRF